MGKSCAGTSRVGGVGPFLAAMPFPTAEPRVEANAGQDRSSPGSPAGDAVTQSMEPVRLVTLGPLCSHRATL